MPFIDEVAYTCNLPGALAENTLKRVLTQLRSGTVSFIQDTTGAVADSIEAVDYRVSRLIFNKYSTIADTAIRYAISITNGPLRNLNLNQDEKNNLKNWIIDELKRKELTIDSFDREDRIAIAIGNKIQAELKVGVARGLLKFTTHNELKIGEENQALLAQAIDIAITEIKTKLIEEREIERVCKQYADMTAYSLLKEGAKNNEPMKIKAALTKAGVRADQAGGGEINTNMGDGFKCAGYRAIHWAASYGHVAAIDALREGGADFNIFNTDYTPLHTALCWVVYDPEKAFKTIRALLDGGAKANLSETKYNWSPLHYAIYYGAYYYKNHDCFKEIINLLLQHDANPKPKNSSNESAIDLAKRLLGDDHKIVGLLESGTNGITRENLKDRRIKELETQLSQTEERAIRAEKRAANAEQKHLLLLRKLNPGAAQKEMEKQSQRGNKHTLFRANTGHTPPLSDNSVDLPSVTATP